MFFRGWQSWCYELGSHCLLLIWWAMLLTVSTWHIQIWRLIQPRYLRICPMSAQESCIQAVVLTNPSHASVKANQTLFNKAQSLHPAHVLMPVWLYITISAHTEQYCMTPWCSHHIQGQVHVFNFHIMLFDVAYIAVFSLCKIEQHSPCCRQTRFCHSRNLLVISCMPLS